MTRYWAIPTAFITGFFFAFIWDLADGSDDVPPWIIEPIDNNCD